MTNSSSDKQSLDAYLAGKDPLSAAYQQTDAAGPSELTDARILAAARHAISKSVAGASPEWRQHWMIPASLAAMLLLSVSVVLVMQQVDDIVPTTPEIRLADSDQRDIARTDKPEDKLSVGTDRIEPEKPAPTKKNIELADAGKTSPAPAAKPTEPPLVIAQAESHDSVGAKGADITTPAPAAVGANTGFASGKPDSTVQTKKESDSAGYKKGETKIALQETSEQEGSRQREQVARLDAKQKTLAKSIAKPAETWLEEISKLLKNGKTEPARKELKAFHSAYPAHVIDAKRFPEIVKLQDQSGSKLPP